LWLFWYCRNAFWMFFFADWAFFLFERNTHTHTHTHTYICNKKHTERNILKVINFNYSHNRNVIFLTKSVSRMILAYIKKSATNIRTLNHCHVCGCDCYIHGLNDTSH
jgi:hypothetical protein